MSKKEKAIRMLDRILDEDPDWTEEAIQSLEMGIKAIKLAMLIDEIKLFLGAVLFIVGLVLMTAIESNAKVAGIGLACIFGAAIFGGTGEDG